MAAKIALLLFFFCFIQSKADQFESALGHIKPITTLEVQKKAVEDLLQRLIPDRASEFFIEIDPEIAPAGKDAFKIKKTGVGVNITGSSGVAAAWGFHHYLKYYCKGHVSWEVVQLNLPKPLPDADYRIISNDRFRYYLSVCAYSYSHVWWNWKDWEKHIDWMALNGLNLVLAPVGAEAIWQRVYKKFGLSQEEIDSHFTGPSYLSWHRMGNLRGWAGPLSKHWHLRSLVLQKAILSRMREFGITPVLHAFNGYVPKDFKRLYPASKLIKSNGTWAKFDPKYGASYFLEPTDPLFTQIGRAFLKEQTAEFGTGHVYNCDVYNELVPHSKDTEVLANISRTIYSVMAEEDPLAVWLIQSWMFFYSDSFWTKELAETFLRAVPLGRMLILDSQSEHFPQYQRFESFFGQPYIWTLLNNFGGNNYFYGPAAKINTGVFKAREFVMSTMVGTGIAPEGIESNYVIYDLMTEMSWRTLPAELDDWFKEYAVRRYGKDNQNAKDAWKLLLDTVYSYDTTVRYKPITVVNTLPKLGIGPYFFYDTKEFLRAWELLVNASADLKDSDGFRYDLADVTREALQIFCSVYFVMLRHEYKQKDIPKFQEVMIQMQNAFKDFEAILSTRKEFLLGAHLERVKGAANSTKERELFEYNARMLLTLWGPRAEILDYGAKEWAGLISDYYAPRWELYMSVMNDSLVYNYKTDFQYARKVIFQNSVAFTKSKKLYPSKPTGDTVDVAEKIFARYKSVQKTPPKYSKLETDFTKAYERLIHKLFA